MWLSLVVVAAAVVLWPHPLSAQCAMCRRSLESPEGQQMIAALRSGGHIGEAFRLGDRVGVLDEGRMVASGRPTDIARSSNPHVRRLLDALPAIPHV